MFRTERTLEVLPKTVNCVLMDGGVGDHVGGSLIAVNYILNQYPWMSINLWLPDLLHEFACNVLGHQSRLYVGSYSDMPTKYNPDTTTINTKWDGRFSPMKVHTTDYAFAVLCDENPSIEHKASLRVNTNPISIKHFSLPKKYVVILAGFTAKVREFHHETVNELTDFIKAKGYTPVFLGKKSSTTGAKHIIEAVFSEQIDYSKGRNLLDQTSLLQAAKIMHNSSAVLGVDCGLMHVAACTNAYIVGGYTTVNPSLREPIRLSPEGVATRGWRWFPVIPDESLGCRFCQVRTNFIYDHDYRDCLYKDYACTRQLTASKFIKHLNTIL